MREVINFHVPRETRSRSGSGLPRGANSAFAKPNQTATALPGCALAKRSAVY